MVICMLNVRSSLMAVNIHITIIELNALHTKRQNLFQELDAVIHLLMEAKHWGLRKSRNATSLNSRFKRSEERFSRNAETDLVCRLLLEKKKSSTRGRVTAPRRGPSPSLSPARSTRSQPPPAAALRSAPYSSCPSSSSPRTALA